MAFSSNNDILIENSLGINCLDEVVSLMLERTNDPQFILTSHHPYIINRAPVEYWKLATRCGSEISVSDASRLPGMQGKSAHDKFIRLINLPEYEDGIQ